MRSKIAAMRSWNKLMTEEKADRRALNAVLKTSKMVVKILSKISNTDVMRFWMPERMPAIVVVLSACELRYWCGCRKSVR